MTTITPKQLKKINTIISVRKIDRDTKAMMVVGFTAGRSESSKDLYYNEAILFIKHLEQTDPHAEAANKMRRKVLYYAHEMGWRIQKNGKMIADIKRVDQWCLKFGYKKRKLDGYSYAELPKLLSQYEAVYKHFIQSL